MDFGYVISLALIIVVVGCRHCKPANKGSLFKCGKVYITVNSLKAKHIELNWITENCRKSELPDVIELYDEEPKHPNIAPLLSINGSYDGYYETNISFHLTILPGDWQYTTLRSCPTVKPGPRCLNYWILSQREYEIIDTNCLKIEPTWMGDNRDAIGQLQIASMFIPGTHNSASYGGKLPELMDRYALTQDTDIWTQLVFGNRYLDLRVGYYSESFSLQLGSLKSIGLEEVLEIVKIYLELAKEEIVILDFQQLANPDAFTESVHRNLISLIKVALEDLIMPMNGSLRISDFWAENKRIIVSYKDTYQKDHPWLWNPVSLYVTDVRGPTDLKKFVHHSISHHNYTIENPLWAIQLVLTRTSWELLNLTLSNRALANLTNTEIPVWFTLSQANKTNIVTTNYFLGNNLVDVAIHVNQMKRTNEIS